MVDEVEKNFSLNLIQENVISAHREMAGSPLLQFIDASGVIRVHTPTLKKPIFNCVLQAQIDENCLDYTVEQVISEFKTLETDFIWTVSPKCGSAGLAECLVSHGGIVYQPYYFGIKELSMDPSPCGLPDNASLCYIKHVQQLDDWAQPQIVTNQLNDEEAKQWSLLYKNIFETSNRFHFFCIYQNGDPVSSALLYIDNQTAGLYHACTMPKARNQGFNNYLQCCELELSKKIGCNMVVIVSSEMNYHTSEKNGFRFYQKCNDYIFKYEKGE